MRAIVSTFRKVSTETDQAQARRETVEERFLAHLEALRPSSAYLRLFREIVLLEWRNASAAAEEVKRIKAERLSELSERMEKLEEAHIFKGSITAAVYERQRDKLQEEIALAELELHESRLNEFDVKGLLAFAEHLVTNVGSIWLDATLPQRQDIQSAVFPSGLPFDGENFGTAATCLLFSDLGAIRSAENDLASPTGSGV